MNLHGFELVREAEIKEINSQVRLYRHIRTGAELLSLENSDDNKAFGVTFVTPPPDNTGLPHILEHTVLGGSRKYPVKEPFVELLKGSLKTFLNAMTFDDFTSYPVASQNLKDFYNLVDVYLDAVFYPLITENHLKQEGWHFELDNPEGELIFKGVVFNEMKGSYSSPDRLLGQYTQEAILPDTPYALDAGGDPAAIPDLTYEQFKAFHDTYYHPSNARFFFYGDDDPQERLRLIDSFIADFDRLEIDTTIPLQPRFDQPRLIKKGYDAGDEEEEDKGMMTVSWLLTETADVDQTLALQILSYILVDTPASPLRKALIDSGLGEDITGGLSTYQREVYFSTGLKGIDPEDAPQVEALILETLSDLAENGIDPDMIEAAINTTEFHMRELNTGSYPRGLALMIDALPTWIHGGDVLAALSFENPLQRLKEQAANNGYFEDLIGQHLLQNSHRSTVILQPDMTLREKREAAEKERLLQARAEMNAAALDHVIADTHELRRLQQTPDTPESLKVIPRLALSDLDREIKRVPTEQSTAGGTTLLFHDLPTSSVAYLDIAINLHTLPAKYLPYIQLFGRVLLEMGTAKEDFVKLSQHIGRKTGGIRTGEFTSSVPGQEKSEAWMTIRAKAMAAGTQELLDILRDILLTVRLDNADRFKQIVLEEKSGNESFINYAGQAIASARLRSHFNEADWAAEQMGGLDYVFFVRELADRVENDWPSVLADLETIWRTLINQNNMVFNVTLDAENWTVFQPQLAALIADLPAAPVKIESWDWRTEWTSEGLTTPAQVNYVAKAANLYDLGYTAHGSSAVIMKYVNTAYLWEKVRVLGGAYGGRGGFDRFSGLFTFLSWRDPNLLVTLDNYDKTGDFLRDLELDQDELVKSIIGAISDMDTPLMPDGKGYSAMVRHVLNYTDEQRQQWRDEVLGTTVDDFKAFAAVLDKVKDNGLVAVVGSQKNIEAANAERGNFLKVTKVL